MTSPASIAMVMLGPPNRGSDLARQDRRRGRPRGIRRRGCPRPRRRLAIRSSRILAVPPCEFGIVAGGRGDGSGFSPLARRRRRRRGSRRRDQARGCRRLPARARPPCRHDPRPAGQTGHRVLSENWPLRRPTTTRSADERRASPRDGWPAIDYGRRRIGVAICDAERIICSPLCVHQTTGDRAIDTLFFQRLVADETVAGFVVGLPVHADGSDERDVGRGGAVRRAGWAGSPAGRSSSTTSGTAPERRTACSRASG